jgi:hypothetical protein
MMDSAIPAHKFKSVFGKNVRLIRQSRDGPGIEARQAAECIVLSRAPSAQKPAGHIRRINRFLKTGDTLVVKRQDMLAKSTIDLLMLLKATTDQSVIPIPRGETGRHHNCRSADVTILGGLAEFER